MHLSEEEIRRIFKSFEGKKVLVIGDVMVDAYWMGRVDRISPEAPVPVVHIQKKEYRPGGAANVALNLKKLGAEPVLCSVIGHDHEGIIFREMMEKEGIRFDGLLFSENRPTTVKTRVISGKHQMLRIDSEEDGYLHDADMLHLQEQALGLLEKCELVIFEDYDKGTITPQLIDAVVSRANELNIPVAVDPKKKHFMDYRSVTLFKPNLRELSEGMKLEISAASPVHEIEQAAQRLKEKLGIKNMLVTLSEKGVLIISEKEGNKVVPAHVRDIFDVSGAGDTVISVAALTLLSGVSFEVTGLLSNLAGGLVCEKAGVVPVDRDALLKEAIKVLAPSN